MLPSRARLAVNALSHRGKRNSPRKRNKVGAFWTTHHASIGPNKSLWCVCGRLSSICFILCWRHRCATFNHVAIFQNPIKARREAKNNKYYPQRDEHERGRKQRATYLRGEMSEIISVITELHRTSQGARELLHLCVCLCVVYQHKSFWHYNKSISKKQN